MKKVYLFGIGGTGSRVIKSLIHLLAAGVWKPNPGQEFELVPVLMDPHQTNEDLKRTIQLIQLYRGIQREIGNSCGFWSAPVNTMTGLQQANTFTFKLENVTGSKFKDYVQYNSMNEASRSLTEFLFSGESVDKRKNKVSLLDVEMDIGFVGNPNIGSVVLNQFKDSEDFKTFAGQFNENDRIFIISSIFGGTGAAGFPTILKNIRNASKLGAAIANAGFLENAKIGSLTMLPYFNIDVDEKSPINRSAFFAKTRAALHYYQEHVNKEVNALYYFGDSHVGKAYPNDPGNAGQKNAAHFAEVAGALAILDFLAISDEELAESKGVLCKEFGIQENKNAIDFQILGDRTQALLKRTLTQLFLFDYYDKHFLQQEIKNAKLTWRTSAPTIDEQFISGDFYQNKVKPFFTHFREWIQELQENDPAFVPFLTNAPFDQLIRSYMPKTGSMFGLGMKPMSKENFNTKLNESAKATVSQSANEKFVRIFFDATDKLITNAFPIF